MLAPATSPPGADLRLLKAPEFGEGIGLALGSSLKEDKKRITPKTEAIQIKAAAAISICFFVESLTK